MVHTTRAVVLKVIRHGDTTVVLKAYTELFGTRSFLVRTGGRTGASRATLQALNRLELVANEDRERDLHATRELRVARPYQNVPFDPVRGALALFVQEVLYKVLHGEAGDHELYGFVEEALEVMDSTAEVRNFPLIFLLLLAAQLGFSPSPPAEGEDRFDLREGHFVRGAAAHGHTLGPQLSVQLAALLPIQWQDMPGPVIPASQRRELLDHLLLYFRMHLEGLGELKSPAILHQVLG